MFKSCVVSQLTNCSTLQSFALILVLYGDRHVSSAISCFILPLLCHVYRVVVNQSRSVISTGSQCSCTSRPAHQNNVLRTEIHNNIAVHTSFKSCSVSMRRLITLFNTQNVMETRLATLYYFEAAEFENGIEILSLVLVFELQLWPEISPFFQLNIRSPSLKVANTLSRRRNSHTTINHVIGYRRCRCSSIDQ